MHTGANSNSSATNKNTEHNETGKLEKRAQIRAAGPRPQGPKRGKAATELPPPVPGTGLSHVPEISSYARISSHYARPAYASHGAPQQWGSAQNKEEAATPPMEETKTAKDISPSLSGSAHQAVPIMSDAAGRRRSPPLYVRQVDVACERTTSKLPAHSRRRWSMEGKDKPAPHASSTGSAHGTRRPLLWR